MSNMFEWKPEYSVGIGSIDAQHQNLFAVGRELYTAMTEGKGNLTIGRILDRLVQYTGVHFAHEERLMRLHDYPGFNAHKGEHDKLKAQVVKFQEEFRAGRASMSVQLLQFVRQWLESHIKQSDTRYAPYLKERAVA